MRRFRGNRYGLGGVWRYKPLLLILAVVITFSVAVQVNAEEVTISAFWDLLRETRAALIADDAAALETLHARWREIDAVILDNESIAIETDWIRLASDADLIRWIDALLAYESRVTDGTGGASLAALASVLRDPRFQYPPDITPTPLPTPIPPPQASTGDGSILLDGLAQVALIALFIIVAFVVITYIIRSLNTQALPARPLSAEDDPTTSAEATARAAELESVRDYRLAMRQRYLACLLLLDERGVIRYDPSLTNYEHLRQVRDQGEVYDLLNAVIHTFENVWYGFEPVDEARYRQYVAAVERLQQIVGTMRPQVIP